MIIISDPTVPEISSTYVTDLATDGSAELDPDGLPTPSSATDTISLLAIPPHLTQTPRCADRPEPTRLHTTRTRIAVPLSALNHCRYLRNVAATHTSTSADLSRVLPPCLHHRSSRHFSPPATLPIATALAAALSAPPTPTSRSPPSPSPPLASPPPSQAAHPQCAVVHNLKPGSRHDGEPPAAARGDTPVTTSSSDLARGPRGRRGPP